MVSMSSGMTNIARLQCPEAFRVSAFSRMRSAAGGACKAVVNSNVLVHGVSDKRAKQRDGIVNRLWRSGLGV